VNIAVATAPARAWIVGGVACALATVVAVGARAHAVEAPGVTGWLGAVGVLLVLAAVALGWAALVGTAMACLVASWALSYAGVGPSVDAGALAAGVGCLVTAELATWSIDVRRGALPARLALGQMSAVLAVGLVAAALGGGLLVLADTVGRGGVAAMALGVLAVMAVIALVAALLTPGARGGGATPRR
jgi:hypothetical protein